MEETPGERSEILFLLLAFEFSQVGENRRNHKGKMKRSNKVNKN